MIAKFYCESLFSNRLHTSMAMEEIEIKLFVMILRKCCYVCENNLDVGIFKKPRRILSLKSLSRWYYGFIRFNNNNNSFRK